MSPELPTNPLRGVFTPEPVLIVGLGERMSQCRAALRMRSRDLALEMGASPNMIRNWELRESIPIKRWNHDTHCYIFRKAYYLSDEEAAT